MPITDLLARGAVKVFYRMDAVGRVPPGPAIILPNHPNALLDPAVVVASAGRPVRFLAKSTLFKGLLAPLVRGAGAIPVHRRQDAGADPSRNTDMFEAVDAALMRGEAICIFPEGISHSTGRLEPLRSGAARMALSAAAKGVPVTLVPVGINAERKTIFRSRITVIYGRPFDVPPDMTAPALTGAIAQRMRDLIVEADPEADAALVMRIDRLYAAERNAGPDAHAAIERRRAIAAGLKQLRLENPAWYDAALVQLRRYDQRLARFGVGDDELDWEVSRRAARRFAIRELPAALVLLPIAAAASVVFVVPYVLTALAARFQSETDVTATAKVIAGTIIYSAWTLLVATGVASGFGARAGVWSALLLPALAAAGLLAIERETAALRTARSWLALRGTHPDTRERLRRHRAELAGVLDEMNAWLNSAETSRRT